MRFLFGGVVAALLLTIAAYAQADATLFGEYVEARTANVYIGACHANGESVTTGREAMLIWHVQQGMVNGVKLDGLKAVAVVAGNDNLAWAKTKRRAVIYVDEKATAKQREALANALKEKYAGALGQVIAVKSAPIEFAKNGLEYTVRVPDVAYLKTTRYACDHCVMPHNVWYQPFISLKSSLVARAAVSEYKGAPELATRWRRTDENSSYVGEFAF